MPRSSCACSPTATCCRARELPEVVQTLIAARLDALSAERKSLRHYAAVLGTVFWIGAVAASVTTTGRARAALHELARGARPPCEVTSMEGQPEYTFWHSSSATSPTARSRGRSGRAGTARRPPGSSARQASGSRTWPSFSPITTCRRSSSPRRPATPSRQESLPSPLGASSRSLGERALGLDTVQGPRRLARALELCPTDDPGRPELLPPLGKRRLPGQPPARGRRRA